MHYLVTGGAGFIGTNIVKQLVEDGHKVRVFDNYINGYKPQRFQEGAEYIEGDIRNTMLLRRAMRGIDGVFHEAAVPRVPYSIKHPQETNDHNINGTINVLMVARDTGVKRVVFANSSSIYGSDDPVPLTEDMPKCPKSPYALQKLVGGEYCRLFSKLYDLETVSLVYFNIYGPYMDHEGEYALVIDKFLLQCSKGKPMTICGDGKYYRDYTHVADCVKANILAMQSEKVGKGELINIGNGRPYSVNDLARIIGGYTTIIPARQGEPRYVCADITQARVLLGWEPFIPLETGIAELKKEFYESSLIKCQLCSWT